MLNNLFSSILFALLLSATSAYGMESKQRAAQATEAASSLVFDKNIPQVLTMEHMPDGIAMPNVLVRLINEYHINAWDYPYTAWLERALCFNTNMQFQTAIQLSDGRIAVGTSNGVIYIFDIANKTQIYFDSHLIRNNGIPNLQREEIKTLVELPNDRIFLRSYYNVCEIWDISTSTPMMIKKWRWDLSDRQHVIALPNNILATHTTDSIIFYSAEDGTKMISRLGGVDIGLARRDLEINSLIKLTDTVLASGSCNGTDGLIIWDIQTHNGITTPVEIANIAHHNQAGDQQNVALLKKISDTLMLSTAGDDNTKEGALRLWDISDPRHPVELSKTIIIGTGYYVGHYIQNVIVVSSHIIAAYSKQNRTIYFYDISNPARPHQVGTMPFYDKAHILAYQAEQFISIENSNVFLYKTNQQAVAELARLSEVQRNSLSATIAALDTRPFYTKLFPGFYPPNAFILPQALLDRFNALPEVIKQTLQSHHSISPTSVEANQETARKAGIARLPFVQRKWAEFKELPTKQKLMVIGGVILAGAYAYSKFKKRSPKTPSAVNAWRFLRRRVANN